MSIENFGIIAGYTIWLYILVCMGCKISADRTRSSRAIRDAEWIRRLFEPNGERRGKIPLARLLRCSRSDALLEQIAGSFARNASSYSAQERAFLEQTVLEILLHRIEADKNADALTRCVILRCIGLTGIRCDRIEVFLSDCASGSELERLWVRTLQHDKDPVGADHSGGEGVKIACN